MNQSSFQPFQISAIGRLRNFILCLTLGFTSVFTIVGGYTFSDAQYPQLTSDYSSMTQLLALSNTTRK